MSARTFTDWLRRLRSRDQPDVPKKASSCSRNSKYSSSAGLEVLGLVSHQKVHVGGGWKSEPRAAEPDTSRRLKWNRRQSSAMSCRRDFDQLQHGPIVRGVAPDQLTTAPLRVPTATTPDAETAPRRPAASANPETGHRSQPRPATVRTAGSDRHRSACRT